MPHQYNAIVAELEKSRRAAPDEKSVRLARAVVRIEELEAQGVRFGRETGGMVKVEAPPGVVVDWHDRGLWSGIHAMVLDYLEARDVERKARAPEPGAVGIAVPGASDRMSMAPEPTVEAARLREELDAATRSVATIAAATGQAEPDAAASLADGIVTVARGAMATAYKRSHGRADRGGPGASRRAPGRVRPAGRGPRRIGRLAGGGHRQLDAIELAIGAFDDPPVTYDPAEMAWAGAFVSLNYLGRVSKARILDAVREARGEASADLIDHLKKRDMAVEAERLLAGSGWLPEPLRRADGSLAPEGTPDSASGVDLAAE